MDKPIPKFTGKALIPFTSAFYSQARITQATILSLLLAGLFIAIGIVSICFKILPLAGLYSFAFGYLIGTATPLLQIISAFRYGFALVFTNAGFVTLVKYERHGYEFWLDIVGPILHLIFGLAAIVIVATIFMPQVLIFLKYTLST